MIAKRKARRKEPADEEVVVVCVPFSLGISNEADEGKIFVIFVVQSICLSLSLSLKRENAQAHSMVVCGDDVGSSPRLELLNACLLNCSLLRVDG